jgi:hypothetical protein
MLEGWEGIDMVAVVYVVVLEDVEVKFLVEENGVAMVTTEGESSLMLIDDWFWKTAGALAFLNEFTLE